MSVRLGRTRMAIILLVILSAVLWLINTSFVWKWMYPIKYMEEIKQSSQRFQMDPMLILAIIRTESSFDTKQISHKGAVGLMQLMPDTAKWVIEQAGFDPMAIEYLDDPKVNIDIGTWYIKFLLNQFNGDLVRAIAAYNAGPGKVNQWLSNQQWDGTLEKVSEIPYKETRHYVQRVLYYQNRYEQIYADDFR